MSTTKSVSTLAAVLLSLPVFKMVQFGPNSKKIFRNRYFVHVIFSPDANCRHFVLTTALIYAVTCKSIAILLITAEYLTAFVNTSLQ